MGSRTSRKKGNGDRTKSLFRPLGNKKSFQAVPVVTVNEEQPQKCGIKLDRRHDMIRRPISMTVKPLAKAALGIGLSLIFLAAGAQAQAKGKTPAPATGASSATPTPTGPKIRIAVTDLANAYTSDTTEGRTTYTPPNGFNEGLTEMMITSLVATGRFTVLERTALQSVLGEQKLGKAGWSRHRPPPRLASCWARSFWSAARSRNATTPNPGAAWICTFPSASAAAEKQARRSYWTSD